MKQLYVTHEGHRVAIDPVTGQIQANIEQQTQQWPKWAKARKALSGVAPAEKRWIRQPAGLINEQGLRRVLMEGPEGTAWEFLTCLETGARIERTDILFPDVALVGESASPAQVAQRQSILAARGERLRQQAQFLEQARSNSTQSLQEVACPPGQASDRDWTQDGRGGLIHPAGWKLSAVLHGRTGGFLGFHLAHTPSGWMGMVRQPSNALAAVDSIEMGRHGPGLEVVSWRSDETPLGALLNGAMGRLLVRAQVEDTPLWWGQVRGQEGVMAGSGEGRLLLVGEQARAWDAFAKQAWTAWRQENESLRQAEQS